VSYREGLGTNEPTPNWNLWESDVGGKHISTKIPIQIRSMEPEEEGDPVWDGNIVVDERGTPIPIPQSMPGSLLAYVGEGISNALSNSPHSSLPMTHVHVQVGRLKELTTRVASIVTGATSTVLRRRIRDAGMGPILEPFVALKITVNESSLGKVVKDLTEHSGEVVELSDGTNVGPSGQEDIGGFSDEGVYIPPEWLSPSGSHISRTISYGSRMKRSLQGIAPLSQFLDYSNRLRAMSEGHGIFEMTNAGFKPVSQERKMEILREIGRA
jgi:elongation factor G